MPTAPCKTCRPGTTPPPGARFCRTCGRPLQPRGPSDVGRRVALAIGLVLFGFVALTLIALWPTGRRAATVVRAVPAPIPPSAMPLRFEPTLPPPDRGGPLRIGPVRAGDTDLYADPLAAYAGGPQADRLILHGVGIGTPAADVPANVLAESTPDHLRDTAGNLYAVDDGWITEVHVCDPALLARWPIDGTHALIARFGEPADVDQGDGEDHPTFLYPARGINVHWDATAGRIAEVVLHRPTRP